MGFQKKGATPAKNVQAKKKGKQAFKVETDDDLDMLDMGEFKDSDDDDSSEEMEVLKTPINKTPKGRKSMSEKKVSFDLSGQKNNKTPKQDTSLLTKKQITPAAKGKLSLPALQGIKQKTSQKGGDSEDKDDDDLEDDDDDLEDDDDNLDDEEDDDVEDDDEEKNVEPVKNTKGQKKIKDQNNLQNKQKSPVKGVDKSKDLKNSSKTAQTTKAGQTLNGVKKETLKMDDPLMAEHEKRRKNNLTMLFLNKLPSDVTPEELKTLSTDILDVDLPLSRRQKKGYSFVYGFLIFANEAKTDENYKMLQTKKFRGQPLIIDFVGEKSQFKKDKQEERQYHPKRLFVTGIPSKATLAEVAPFFPTAFQITFNASPLFRNATLVYSAEDAAHADYMATQDIEIDGHKLTVSYAFKDAGAKRTRRNIRNRNNSLPPAKKMKTMKFV